MPTLTLTERDGTKMELQCSQEIWEILSSSNTDGASKVAIINALKKASETSAVGEGSSDTSLMLSSESSRQVSSDSSRKLSSGSSRKLSSDSSRKSSSDSSRELSSDSSCESSSAVGVHAWTSREEDVLVAARHDRDDDFRKSKNHTSLWKEIANEIGSVTALQAMHKYNNLKKRWKEVLDSGTGTEAKYFRHREAFDQQYGTRSSTKPKFTIDSTGADEEKEAIENENEIVSKPKKEVKEKKEKKQQGKKRQHNEIIDLIERQNEQFTERVTKFHEDKMMRYDRFLNILEGKKKTDGNQDN